MRGASGYADGLISGATWGLVAVLVARQSGRMPGQSALATPLVMAAVLDSAAALFLFVRSGVAGALPRVLGLLTSRNALTLAACSLLGGPVFMGGYVLAVILAGPSYALTATATYPVFGALLAQRLLHQRLNRVAWLGVSAAGLGAAVTAVDASSSVDGGRTLVGVAIALTAALGLALEGIAATRAMAKVDADTAAAVRGLFSAALFAVVLLAVPSGVSIALTVGKTRELWLPIVLAGFIGGYSFAVWYHSMHKIGVARAMALNITYAMWGILFAWAFQHARPSPLAVVGCVIVTAGAVVTIMSGERPVGGTRNEPQESLGPQGVTR
jgi:drug/metabolite transporter (DMT)-like permease